MMIGRLLSSLKWSLFRLYLKLQGCISKLKTLGDSISGTGKYRNIHIGIHHKSFFATNAMCHSIGDLPDVDEV